MLSYSNTHAHDSQRVCAVEKEKEKQKVEEIER